MPYLLMVMGGTTSYAASLAACSSTAGRVEEFDALRGHEGRASAELAGPHLRAGEGPAERQGAVGGNPSNPRARHELRTHEVLPSVWKMAPAVRPIQRRRVSLA